MEMQDLDLNQINAALKQEEEWAKCVIFDEQCNILAHKNCQPEQSELQAYLQKYNDRDTTIGQGFILLKQHYDVHRFHPPLIYGRRGNADEGEGISLAVGFTKSNKKVYMIITYELPIISARAVPQQINFYNKNIGELERFN